MKLTVRNTLLVVAALAVTMIGLAETADAGHPFRAVRARHIARRAAIYSQYMAPTTVVAYQAPVAVAYRPPVVYSAARPVLVPVVPVVPAAVVPAAVVPAAVVPAAVVPAAVVPVPVVVPAYRPVVEYDGFYYAYP